MTDSNEYNLRPDSAGMTSYTLLDKVLDEQADAWVRLVRLYTPLVMRWCGQWGLQASDAQNVCQEVFRAIHSGLTNFRSTNRPGSFRAWLRAIAKHKMVDLQRVREKDAIAFGGSEANRQFNQISVDDEYSELNASEDIRFLYRQAVELIRTEFSEQDWNAFFQVTVEAKSPAETAKSLGISVNSVYLARSRIIKRVKEGFSKLIDEGRPAE